MKYLKLFALAFIACLTVALAAVAGNTDYSPYSGFFPISVIGGNSTSTYITLANEAATLPNSRQLSLNTSRFNITDNGAGGTLVVDLKTVTIGFGGTGATTQQGAINAVAGFAGVALGDMMKYNGSNWVRFPIGTANQVLTMNAGGTDFAWSAAGAAAPAAATYITLNNESATLPNSRRLAGTANDITLTDGGAGTTITFDIGTNVVTLVGTQTLTNKTLTAPIISAATTTGYILKGTTFNDTVVITDPAAARTLTIPDPGGNASFVMTAGAQTVGGVKTFSATPVLSTNAITTSGANTNTLQNATDTFVYLATTDTLSNKTLASPIVSSQITLSAAAHNFTITWANPAAAETYNIADVGTNCDFAMTASGTSYANGRGVYANGSVLATVAAGSSGAAFVSGGAGAPSWTTLGAAGGGTGVTTVPAKGSMLVGNSGGTAYANLAVGADTFVLTADSAQTNGVKWAAAAGGGSGTVNSGTATQLAYYATSTNAVSSAADTLIVAGALSLGLNTGPAGSLQLYGATTGNCTVQVAAAAGTNITLTLPTVATTMPTAQPSVGGAVLVATTGGAQSYISGVTAASGTLTTGTATSLQGNVVISGVTSGTATITTPAVAATPTFQLPASGAGTTQALVPFGGNGSDGAISQGAGIVQQKIWYATTWTTSANFNCFGCAINSSGTASIPTGVTVTDSGGCPGAPAQTTATADGVEGYGPAGGRGGGQGTIGSSVVGGGGGGSCIVAGGNGGNAAGPSGQGGQTGNSATADFHTGSGGGGGGTGASGSGGAGGKGGGCLRIYANGAQSITSTGGINVSGANGTNATTLAGGGGGGAGGSVWIFSATSSAIGTSLINIAGGTGGTGTGASSGGGGGGGSGYVYQMSPSNSGTVTTTGGAGGTGTGASGSTGGAGSLVSNTQTPTLPCIVYCENTSGVFALTHLEQGRKWLRNEPFDHLQFTAHENTTWLAAFYAKPGCFNDLCYMLNYGGDVDKAVALGVIKEDVAYDPFFNPCTAYQPGSELSDSLAQCKADPKVWAAFPPIEQEAQTCDDTEFLRPST